MDFQKIKLLVNKGITVNTEDADANELRYSFDNGKNWFEITPEKYSSEEEIVAIINTEVERKKFGKIKNEILE